MKNNKTSRKVIETQHGWYIARGASCFTEGSKYDSKGECQRPEVELKEPNSWRRGGKFA